MYQKLIHSESKDLKMATSKQDLDEVKRLWYEIAKLIREIENLPSN
jgi:hypothetical protein